jgi:hypothetical protein
MAVTHQKSIFPSLSSESMKPPRRITEDKKRARSPEPFTASET